MPMTRSQIMARIRSTETGPEVRLRRALRGAGATGYRKNLRIEGARGVGASADVCWPGRRVAVFVDGCFWHGCPECGRRTPKTNSEFWREKIRRNRERDRRQTFALEAAGWAVVRVWEHEPVDVQAAKVLLALGKCEAA